MEDLAAWVFYDEAFSLACEWRQKMLLELNAQGAGYTENHGKDSK